MRYKEICLWKIFNGCRGDGEEKFRWGWKGRLVKFLGFKGCWSSDVAREAGVKAAVRIVQRNMLDERCASRH